MSANSTKPVLIETHLGFLHCVDFQRLPHRGPRVSHHFREVSVFYPTYSLEFQFTYKPHYPEIIWPVFYAKIWPWLIVPTEHLPPIQEYQTWENVVVRCEQHKILLDRAIVTSVECDQLGRLEAFTHGHRPAPPIKIQIKAIGGYCDITEDKSI